MPALGWHPACRAATHPFVPFPLQEGFRGGVPCTPHSKVEKRTPYLIQIAAKPAIVQFI